MQRPIILPLLRKLIYSGSYQNNALKNVRSIVSYSTVTAQDVDTEPKWQLVAAACITRAPIVCPPLKPVEKQYMNLMNTLETEHSLKSDHELRIEEDKVRIGLLNAGDVDKINMEEASRQTGLEFEDKSKEELEEFKFAPIITECDKMENKSSLNRALNQALVLSVKQKLGSQYHRVLPQTPWIPGETLKQSCERVIRETCGSRVKVKVFGNAPCGHFKYKYPKEVRKEGFIGAKVFFFSAHVLGYDSEGLESSEDYKDFEWLTHEELKGSLGKSYSQAVSRFLISDD